MASCDQDVFQTSLFMEEIRPLWLCAVWVMPDLAQEVSTQQRLVCRCNQVSSSAELMTKRCPKGSGVFVIGAVSKKRRRRKIGAVELCCVVSVRGACSINHSSIPYESVRTTLKSKQCDYPKKHTKHLGSTINSNRQFRVPPQSTIYDLLDLHGPMI